MDVIFRTAKNFNREDERYGKTKGEQLQEELMMKMVNGTTRLSDEEIDKAYDYAEGYKKYMDAAKIEMEAVREAIRTAERKRL